MNYFDRGIRKIEAYTYTKRMKRLLCTDETVNTKPRDIEVIASLTSFPARFETLPLVIESIFRQTYKPDKICLYLDKNVTEDQIPEQLQKLRDKGLSIIIDGEGIGSQKKYYYAMIDNPDAVVITLDDDDLYRNDTIEKLMRSYKRYPECVSCMRAHEMVFGNENEIRPYKEWNFVSTKFAGNPRMDLLATGVGGVLYPPRCMSDKLFDLDMIHKLDCVSDDIWLKVMQILKGTRVIEVESKKRLANPLPTKSTRVGALTVDLGSYGRNDEHLKLLSEEYKIDLYKVVKEGESE